MKIQNNRNGGMARWMSGVVMATALMGVPMPGTALEPGAAMAQVKSVEDVKSILSTTIPADAKEISSVMKTAKVGETITIHAFIAPVESFSKETATFKAVEPGTPMPGTRGELPPPKHVATIAVVDASGGTLKGSLAEKHGLKANTEVFVTGKVKEADGNESLVIEAKSMYVSKAPLPVGFFVDKPAEKATDISEARKANTIKVGDTVTLRGRVGGSKDPFVAGRAVMTLMGRALKACNENADDKCEKPWDYCCETKKAILANSVTVQVTDAKGQVLRTDLKGRRGLKELSDIVVVGKVVVADGKAVVVNATSIAYAE